MSDRQPLAAPQSTVHIVDDDDAARTATARLMRAAGYAVCAYGSAAEFLALDEIAAPSCAILDLSMPGMSGLELQEQLARWADPPAIVFVTGRGQIADSVRAMQRGAVDFLTKPVEAQVLLDAVARAIARDLEGRDERDRIRQLQARHARLTPREREVFAHLVAGQLNKQIAFDLGTAERTVKIHRARVLRKMNAGSIAELVWMAQALKISPAETTCQRNPVANMGLGRSEES